MNLAPHKIKNLLKTFFSLISYVSVYAFNVWPKTTLLLPVWSRDAKGWTPLKDVDRWAKYGIEADLPDPGMASRGRRSGHEVPEALKNSRRAWLGCGWGGSC